MRWQHHELDDGRRLRVVLPDGYERSERRYPVVYVLDERWALGTMADAATMLGMQRLMPKVICVGIGYQDESLAEVSERRGSDYTPTPAPYPDFTGIRGAYPSGQFVETSRRITDEVIPLIEQSYRVDDSDRVLFGHSLSGLGAVWMFLSHPGVFNRYLLSSPSVWWDNEVTASQRLPEPRPGERLFVSGGSGERNTVSGVFEAGEAFTESLTDAGHDATFVELLGEVHHSTIGAAISRGMRWLYRPEA